MVQWLVGRLDRHNKKTAFKHNKHLKMECVDAKKMRITAKVRRNPHRKMRIVPSKSQKGHTQTTFFTFSSILFHISPVGLCLNVHKHVQAHLSNT